MQAKTQQKEFSMGWIEHWHSWFMIASVVLIIELMSGTYFLLAVAGGAFITTVFTAWMMPTITMQILSFAIASALSYFLLQSFRKKKSEVNTDGTQHMIGQNVELVDAFNPQGRVRYKGVLWLAKLEAGQTDEEIPTKTQLVIVAVDGSTLTVKKAA